MNFLWKGHKSPPSGRSWAQDKRSRAARSAVFRENSKWWTKILLILTQLTWVSRVKKVIEQFYWLITFFGFNWGQSYLATLVTPQNYTKKLRNLPFVVQFAYFSQTTKSFNFSKQHLSSFRYKKHLLIVLFFFSATFEHFFFWEIKGNFLENLGQLVENPNQGYRARIELKN